MAASYLIDTNIFIHARDGTELVLDKFEQHDKSIFLSALSLAELHRGLIDNSEETLLRRERHRVLLDRIQVLSFDAEAAAAYGHILALRGRVKARDFDHLIAAHAISRGATLVTNNEADFAGIHGLALENWTLA